MSPTGNEELRDRLAVLETALARLQDALAQPKSEWTRDAAIQRFEFTFELAWKAVASAARHQGVEVASPRRAWQTAFQLGWIDDDRLWLDMLEDRNRASHSYREARPNRSTRGSEATPSLLRPCWPRSVTIDSASRARVRQLPPTLRTSSTSRKRAEQGGPSAWK